MTGLSIFILVKVFRLTLKNFVCTSIIAILHFVVGITMATGISKERAVYLWVSVHLGMILCLLYFASAVLAGIVKQIAIAVFQFALGLLVIYFIVVTRSYAYDV